MSETIQFACPHCQQYLRVAGATAGKSVRCPQCQEIAQVPTPEQRQQSPPHDWVVRTPSGKSYGPVPREELRKWLDENRLDPNYQLVQQNSGRCISAAEMFPEMSDPLAPPSAPPPSSQPHPEELSDKSRLVAGLLGLLLPLAGLYGVHRLYTGHILIGVLMLVTFGGCGIWQIIDVVLVFAGSVTDRDGRPLRD